MWSPQDWNLYGLDRFLVRIGLLCGPCGSFKWDRSCYMSHHWWRDDRE